MNREAKGYLIIEDGYGGDLEGWERVEDLTAELGDDVNSTVMVQTGRMKGHLREAEMPEEGRVFERTFKEGENLVMDPRKGMAKKHVFLFAESDGEGSEEPLYLNGDRAPRVGGKCPDELHDLWVAEKEEDEEVEGVEFRTWHPQVDPIYCKFS